MQIIVRGTLEVVETFHSFELYGKNRYGEDEHIHSMGTEPYEGNPNEDGELEEAFEFVIGWRTKEMEEDFDTSKAAFSYGRMDVNRCIDGVRGTLHFDGGDGVPRMYFDWTPERDE
jgi:hypothetical protein